CRGRPDPPAQPSPRQPPAPAPRLSARSYRHSCPFPLHTAERGRHCRVTAPCPHPNPLLSNFPCPSSHHPTTPPQPLRCAHGTTAKAMAEVWHHITATVASEFADVTDAAQATRIVVRLGVAALLGGLLGWEREHA